MSVRLLPVFALLAVLVAGTGSASTGFQTPALLQWEEASGPVRGYAVFVSRNGDPYPSEPDQEVSAPLARIRGFDGDVVRVRVAAFDNRGRRGPFGPESPSLTFPVLQNPLDPTACHNGLCIPGGGSRRSDCYSEFRGEGLELNYPPFDPTSNRRRKQTEVRCVDGDPTCDHDGQINDNCRFNVDVCLRIAADPNFPECEARDIVKIRVQSKASKDDAAAIEEALDFFLPVTAPICTSGQYLDAPIKRSSSGKARKSTTYVKLTATVDPKGKDTDRLRLRCMPAD